MIYERFAFHGIERFKTVGLRQLFGIVDAAVNLDQLSLHTANDGWRCRGDDGTRDVGDRKTSGTLRPVLPTMTAVND
jgi:hypothetical protein